MKSFIEYLPDYYSCNLAICKYKDVDIAIPIPQDTAKRTFKNRDKDEAGVRRHIVHTVKTHERINSDKDVERHLRGRSDIVIHGEKITISAALEWSEQKALERMIKKRGFANA